MTLQDYDRTVPLALVVLAFLVVTVLVGRRVGAKSLLGLGLTVVCIFSILIPLLLGGWPTLPTILGMCAYVTVVEFVILGGVNRKTLCAILGTISGVAFAALFGELACALLRVNGYKMYSAEPTIEALLQIKQGQDPMHSLQLGDLLVRDGKAERLLRAGQGDPQPPPGAEFEVLREKILHLRTGIARGERGNITVRLHDVLLFLQLSPIDRTGSL